MSPPKVKVVTVFITNRYLYLQQCAENKERKREKYRAKNTEYIMYIWHDTVSDAVTVKW